MTIATYYAWPRWDLTDGSLVQTDTTVSYKWTASGSGTGEFYLTTTADGAIPNLTKPPAVEMNSTDRSEGTAGSLSAWQWDWADNDTLGFSTLYVRLGDDSDPDSQAAGYVMAGGDDTDTGLSEAAAYETVEGFFTNATQNTSEGTFCHVKSGGEETLSVAWTLWTTSQTYPTTIRGYDSSAADGGRGKINAGGYQVLASGTSSGVNLYDMEFRNGPQSGTGETKSLINLNGWCNIIGCIITDCEGSGVHLGGHCEVIGCHIEDCGNSLDALVTFQFGNRSSFCGNYVKQGASRTASAALYLISNATMGMHILDNIIVIDGATWGLKTGDGYHYNSYISGNTILSDGGTSTGISITRELGVNVINNYVEGFSGVGGEDYDINSGSGGGGFIAGNRSYNCTSSPGLSQWEGQLYIHDSGIQVLSASGIEKSGAETYANRFVYFAPKNVDDMQTGGWPEVDA